MKEGAQVKFSNPALNQRGEVFHRLVVVFRFKPLFDYKARRIGKSHNGNAGGYRAPIEQIDNVFGQRVGAPVALKAWPLPL
jgi:hypothetical protein